MEFKDKVFFFKCPECRLTILLNGYHEEKINNIITIKLIYKCVFCHNKKIKELKEEKKENSSEKSINLEIEKKQISLRKYIEKFYKEIKKCPFNCKGKYAFIFYKKIEKEICIKCLFSLFTIIYNNIHYIGHKKYTFKKKKPYFRKISSINKESECIRNVVPIELNVVGYLINQRIIIWDYLKNKVERSFVEEKYISNIIPISNNRLLTFGSSIKVWNLNNIEKTLTPKIFEDLYIIIQHAFEIEKKNQIAFISEDGLFIWNLNNNEINNVIPSHNMTSLCSFLLNEDIIIICTSNKIFVYSISENKYKRFYLDDDNEEIIFGKELSDNRFILCMNKNKIKIFEIEKEDNEINLNILLEKEILLGEHYWEFSIDELTENDIILFLNTNKIYLLNPLNGNLEIIFESDNINKVLYLSKGIIGFVQYNEKFRLFNIFNKQIELTFTNPFYGKISTFEQMSNGDIAICQVRQEFYYSILVLK